MGNKSTTTATGQAPSASWAVTRRWACGGGLLLLSGLAWAQDKAVPALEAFDKARFDRPTVIDNPWLPMKPGMRYVYEGTTVDEGKVVPHRIELHITDLSKVIDGVRVLISYDLDFSSGKLAEAELAFFAQDNDGNVWHLGQYPEEYDNGKWTKSPAWIHGFEGARAGIMMKAKPTLGMPSYSQGWGPAVDWTDRGQTHQMGQATQVKAGSYTDVLVIKETATSEVGAEHFKYYAKGVGNVRVGWSGADKTKETLELVRVETMSAKMMDDIRARALKLEKNAYQRSKSAYGPTAPAERAK